MALTGDRKRAYQREYMRKRRAALKQDLVKSDPANAVAEWCKKTLVVPVGNLQGKPFELAAFQIEWLRGALGKGIKEAFLSCARKNGKSSLIAAVLLAYLVGPLNVPNFHAVTISLQGNLAGELRENMKLIAEASGIDQDLDIRSTPFPGLVIGKNGARVDFLNASEATGNAISCDLVIVDEAGLLKEKLRDMWEATLQSIAARSGRLWAISIRGDGPMFRELIQRKEQPGVFGFEYNASEDCELTDVEAWRAANPGLDLGIKGFDYMEHMAKRAATNAAYAPAFLAKDLNHPLDPSRHMIVSVSQYKNCLVDILPDKDGPAFVGFDLGSSTSMSGCAVYWPVAGRLEVWGAWPAEPNLERRGKDDSKGTLYLQMHERGELTLFPGAILNVNEFVRDAKIKLKDARVKCAGADRHRHRELSIGLQVNNARFPVQWRSTKHDNAADVRAFQAAVIGRDLKLKRSLMLESAIKQSSVIYDSLGNPNLDKSSALSRIDALSAAVIAVGLGESWKQSNERKRKTYHGVVH